MCACPVRSALAEMKLNAEATHKALLNDVPVHKVSRSESYCAVSDVTLGMLTWFAMIKWQECFVSQF